MLLLDHHLAQLVEVTGQVQGMPAIMVGQVGVSTLRQQQQQQQLSGCIGTLTHSHRQTSEQVLMWIMLTGNHEDAGQQRRQPVCC
jgi:hypothetical protein